MDQLSEIIGAINSVLKWPLVFGLLGAGLFLTIKLGFIQFRRLGHGFAVATGRYDDPDEPGDVSHFQALTTALSATVGIGNIAGVAIAIHVGGPGALFWMWVTALLGMTTKFSEVTLAQKYRVVLAPEGSERKWEGTVAGGPMYYIERGLGPKWKPVAILFAFALMLTSFMTGNAIQANTVAAQMAEFGVDKWITGLITASIVGVVIIGGIKRIGAVTGIVAPLMAGIYVLGALMILVLHIPDIPATFVLIFREAFNPTAGVAGAGIGVLLTTLTYGVQRGLFSNEAGQGSAPIAHSAARTDEPVPEGVVALLEPFIDTIIICTMTGLVVILTGVWNDKVPTTIKLGDNNISYVEGEERSGYTTGSAPESFIVTDGIAAVTAEQPVRIAYYDLPVDRFFLDEAQTQPFSGTILPSDGVAVTKGGKRLTVLYGDATRNSAPLTMLGFERGLEPYGMRTLGRWIVLISVFLFALSTSISWSYYGDRCANYLFGSRAIVGYKLVYVVLHFVGAVLAVTTIWDLGDVALSLVTLPNVLSLVLLSGVLKTMTDSYFERQPWKENEEVHKRVVETHRLEREQKKQRPKNGPPPADAPRT